MERSELQALNGLLPKMNFFTGMGSVMNIAGNYFEFSNCDDEVTEDYEAIQSDWDAIGHDIKNAMENHKKQ